MVNPMKQPFETLNHYAPAVTLLVLVGGLAYSVATRDAQFAALGEDMEELQTTVKAVEDDVETVQGEVRSAREAQAHMLSCSIELNNMQREAEIIPTRQSAIVVDVPRETVLVMMMPVSEPESCKQARLRTAPTQGD